MQVKVFNVYTTDTGEALAVLNNFLAHHRVLDMQQVFFEGGQGSGWSFCVRYLTGSTPSGNSQKMDYRQVLSPEHFKVFAHLREIRKTLARADAVPAYAVFTDAELAEIARLSPPNEANLRQVFGIGQKRMEKYGHTLLALFNQNQGTHDAPE